MDKFDNKIDNSEIILLNSKIAFVSQPILPLQMFYKLKEQKHWSKVKYLVKYYHLEEKRVSKTRLPLSDLIRTVSEAQREADANDPSEVHTVLHWEVDSEKFKQTLGPRLGGNERQVSSTEKESVKGPHNT
ncbi:hypothetical protein BDV23DRAFT_179838 [Aspergillus alliaceus]|uniref:Uncharacterized protein n=1 Tax=Petromyces alliaceus TaxID=209559 RepID=A0A5N7CKK8_PETAA|nr:hypothetical protein BDV23DRAFT_179838 [Aspergillus alliaceus]